MHNMQPFPRQHCKDKWCVLCGHMCEAGQANCLTNFQMQPHHVTLQCLARNKLQACRGLRQTNIELRAHVSYIRHRIIWKTLITPHLKCFVPFKNLFYVLSVFFGKTSITVGSSF
jgi:hypothetical protein